MSFEQAKFVKLFTLVIPVSNQNKQVLLGKKRRGFGKGLYNGFGGKVEKGERILDAAARELYEESGLVVGVDHLEEKRCGVLQFVFRNDFEEEQDKKVQVPWQVHIFYINEFSGTITESEEMEPQWFDIENIPYSSMWKDDKFW